MLIDPLNRGSHHESKMGRTKLKVVDLNSCYSLLIFNIHILPFRYKLADMKVDFNLPDATWIAMTNQLMIHQVHTDFYPTVIGGVREDLLRGIMARFGIKHTINDPVTLCIGR